MSVPIKCNLPGNALDYLLLAGEMGKADTPRMLKHAIATLADGVELLLKARLEVYDWSLLFKNVDEAHRLKFEGGDFQSVTFEQAVKRLNGICGVNIPEKELTTINALRKLRNKIRHFAVIAEKAEAASLLSKAYSFAIDFTTAHLEEHLDAETRADLDRLRRLLGEFDEFVTTRLAEIKATLDGQNYSIHVECPSCLQVTLYPEDGEASCAFCGYRAVGEDAARDVFEQLHGHISLKDRMATGYDIESCPECGAPAAVPYETDYDSGVHCLSCGEISLLKKCKRCGGDTYRDYCDYCQYMRDKDD